MQSISNLPAPRNDLRGESKDYLRDHEHKAKWGRTDTPVRDCVHGRNGWDLDVCDKCTPRPPHRGSRQHGRHAHHRNVIEYKGMTKKKVFARQAIGNEIGAAAGSSDTSGDDSLVDSIYDFKAALPDAEIMYSYDAQRGPSGGNDVLGEAVTQAVKRYENKQVEKLVKEYDVVEDFADDGNEADVDEDGFELIDYSQLH